MKNMKNKTTKNNMINYGIVIVLFVIVQALSSTGNLSRLLMGLLVPLCVYTIASVSLNLVVGFSGELSLGHAGFMCVGAFSSALFSQVAADSIPQVPRFILAILVGAAVAALFGVIIGIPVLRLRGDYLAIVTLAFGEIIKNLINVLYIGVDDKGLHVATSAAGLHMDPGGKQILKGALGISGTATLYKDIKNYFFLIGVILLLLTSVYCTEPCKLQKRTCYYVNQGQPYCSGVCRNQYHQIQTACIYDFRSPCRSCRCAVCT